MSISREYVGGIAKAVGERQVRVVVSTSSLDRDGDIIEVKGIDLAAYRLNPIVLNQHRRAEPIARCTDIRIKGDTIEATVQFPDEGVSPKSDEVYGLIKAEILNAVSIGIIPLEWSNMDDKEPWRGKRYNKSEMIEFSVVSVPANSEALIVERGQLSSVDQLALALKNIALMTEKRETAPVAPVPAPPAEPENDESDADEQVPDAAAIKAATQARMRRAAAKVKSAL
ncbi:HK97 family phage prohead protease [Nisaea nitritireducens]|uniref:HK97 family phage prohead protease n=1 Tax=Nisaea nitritireducens TaxID=568392 RepID=UPI0018687603|nr:HK97 family phage prohead protease [Nisaea nitritireducens]